MYCRFGGGGPPLIGESSNSTSDADDSALKAALASGDIQELERAIYAASAPSPLVDEATSLLAALCADEDPVEALVGRRNDADAAKTVKTCVTLLTNVLEHPEEAKFRRIKLSNKTVRKRLVESCRGLGERVVVEAGFSRLVEEHEEVLRIADPSDFDDDTVRIATEQVRRVLDRLL